MPPMSGPDQVAWRGGTDEEGAADFIGVPKEITVNTTRWVLCLHDGITRGGIELGARGKPSEHRWTGTVLQFQNGDGTWGAGVDLNVEASAEQIALITTEGNTQVARVVSEGDTQELRVTTKGDGQIELVDEAGTAQITLINQAGSTQVAAVNQAGTDQVAAVSQAGATQVGAVNSAGSTQVSAVEDKGTEIITLVDAETVDRVATVATEGATQITAVNEAGSAQVTTVADTGTTEKNAVNAEGNTQVGNVTTEGNTQVARTISEGDTQFSRIQAEGAEQIAAVQVAADLTAIQADIDALELEVAGKLDSNANAVSATNLETARTISLKGDCSGSATFDGSVDIEMAVTVDDDSHGHTIDNVTGLPAALDAKMGVAAGNTLMHRIWYFNNI